MFCCGAANRKDERHSVDTQPTDVPMDWQSLIQLKRQDIPDQKLTRSLRQGIPKQFRTQIWLWITDVQYKFIDKHSSDIYEKLKAMPSSSTLQIERDVARTYNQQFQHTASLSNLLTAYSNYDSEVSYTQGMNYIAAVILDQFVVSDCISTEDEHQAFWIFVHILSEMHYREVFKDGMEKAFILMHRFEENLQIALPRVHAQMSQFDVTVQMCFDHVIFSLLLQQSPKAFRVRIIDLFLLEGEVVVLNILIRLVKLMQERILSIKAQDELIIYLRKQVVLDALDEIGVRTRGRQDIMSYIYLHI